jgi:Zn-dependent peptidase ImmA (M78 family)
MTNTDKTTVSTITEIETHRGNDLDAASVYETLINQALTNPGTINKAFSLFHDYSFSNSLLAYFQMQARGLDVTPIGTFRKWKSLNKTVAKGSKALAILYPVFSHFWKDEEVENADGSKTIKRVKITYISGFEVHHEHFALSQCKEYGQETEQRIDLKINWEKVLSDLNIKQVKWDMVEGNAQGYARPMQRELAINPLCTTADKTMVHEIAHVLLHGNDSEFVDNQVLSRNIKEVQAEMVAFLVMSMLGVTDEEVMSESRGYIQNWLKDGKVEPSETKAVIRATEKILEKITNKPKKQYGKRA